MNVQHNEILTLTFQCQIRCATWSNLTLSPFKVILWHLQFKFYLAYGKSQAPQPFPMLHFFMSGAHVSLLFYYYVQPMISAYISTPSILVCLRMGSMCAIYWLISIFSWWFLHTWAPLVFCYVLKWIVWMGS